MSLAPIFQWLAFAAFALFSIGGALGMTTTMSMFRSGIFLMASFMGVAGLFILLSADLLGLLQVMMYVGGMLVMILFMVLFMHDPGGAMMAGMKMEPVARFFTLGIKPAEGEMGGMDMSMTTPIKRYAAVLAIIIGALLVALLLFHAAWPLSSATPDPRSAEKIGLLLMGKYMMVFEGAGLLILIGIFGAVYVARPSRYPDEDKRESRVAVAGNPAPIGEKKFEPEFAMRKTPAPVNAAEIHSDDPEEQS